MVRLITRDPIGISGDEYLCVAIRSLVILRTTVAPSSETTSNYCVWSMVHDFQLARRDENIIGNPQGVSALPERSALCQTVNDETTT